MLIWAPLILASGRVEQSRYFLCSRNAVRAALPSGAVLAPRRQLGNGIGDVQRSFLAPPVKVCQEKKALAATDVKTLAV